MQIEINNTEEGVLLLPYSAFGIRYDHSSRAGGRSQAGSHQGPKTVTAECRLQTLGIYKRTNYQKYLVSTQHSATSGDSRRGRAL